MNVEKVAWQADAEKVLSHGCQVGSDCRWCKEARRIVALVDALDRVEALADEWTAEHRRAESHASSPEIPLGRAARLMREALSLPPEQEEN